jgi:glutamate carboxypeptidase
MLHMGADEVKKGGSAGGGPLDAALAWLRSQQAEMERVLAALVRESSHTENRAGNARVADLLCELFALPELLVERRAPGALGPFGDHLLFQTAAARRSEGAGAVLLLGHHDTVFPAGTFEGYVEDGELLRGPGILDMKGGLVVAWFALAALARAGLLARLPVRLVTVSDEEVGSPTSQPWLRELARGAACALVFESGRMNDAIVTSRKAVGLGTATARGQAAHAGANHEEGRNAIWALARFIDRAQQLTDYGRGVTINVGKVEGGQGKNTVPDLARAHFDLRFVRPGDSAYVLAALREAARAAAQEVPGTSIEVAATVSREPMVKSSASAALLEEYAACARASGLGASEAGLSGGGSDANTVSAVGIAAIDGLGPRGDGFHTKDEYVVRATLTPKAEALARFLAARGHLSPPRV